MSTDLVFTEPEETIPNFVLKGKDGKEVTITAVQVINVATTTPLDKSGRMPSNADEMVEALQLFLLNKHQLTISPMVAMVIFEEAEQIYNSVKKNCMKTADLNGSASTPEPLPPTNEK